MIRREITLPDSKKYWLLTSQVDHAAVSSELARQWRDAFSPEVIDAITHHDDGWAEWETRPKLNPQTGAPYSFLEIPLDEALTIWDRSITSAHQFGPLAGYIVAGHFYTLLSDSNHSHEGHAIAWLTAKRKLRTAWLDQWVRSNPSHTLDVAKQALQMLQLADLFSLWLCGDCPIPQEFRENETSLEPSSIKLRTDSLISRFRFVSRDFTICPMPTGDGVQELSWMLAVDPYPFNKAPLDLATESVMAPVSRYSTSEALRAVSRKVYLRWQLFPATMSENSPQ